MYHGIFWPFVIALFFIADHGSAQIANCMMNYMAPTPPGFVYMLYPLPINGVPVLFDGQSPLQMVYKFYFLEQPLYVGTSLNMAMKLDLVVSNTTVVQGNVYGNDITVSNFTMNGDGWLKVPTTGVYMFMIDSDYAASFFLSNDTASQCAPDPYSAPGYGFFYLGSSTTQPTLQRNSGKVMLYAGIPYRTTFSYIHMSGSVSFAISMITPDNKFIPDIATYMSQLDPWSNALVKPTLNYTREIVSSYTPWSGTTTSFLSVASSTNSPPGGNLTVTSIFYYATPTGIYAIPSSSVILTSPSNSSPVSSTSTQVSLTTISSVSETASSLESSSSEQAVSTKDSISQVSSSVASSISEYSSLESTMSSSDVVESSFNETSGSIEPYSVVTTSSGITEILLSLSSSILTSSETPSGEVSSFQSSLVETTSDESVN